MFGEVAEITDQSLNRSSLQGAPNRDAFTVSVPQQAMSQSITKPTSMYNIQTDVLMRLEVLPDAQILRFFKLIYVTLGICAATLVCLATVKAKHYLESPEAGRIYSLINLIVSISCSVTMVSCTTCYALRVISVTKRGFSWSPRRQKQACMGLAQCVAQCLNSIFYLLPNVLFVFGGGFSSYELFKWLGMLRVSMWIAVFSLFVLKAKMLNPWLDSKNEGIGREDALKVDQPWTYHWLLFILWCASEVVLFCWSPLRLGDDPQVTSDERGLTIVHPIPESAKVYAAGVTGIMAFYHLLGIAYIFRGYQLLLRKPYYSYRTTNIAIRFHLLNSGSVGHFVTLSIILLFWVAHESYGTGYLTILGFLPAQIAMTVLTSVNCIITMPVKPGRQVKLKKIPNRLAWQLSDLQQTTANADGSEDCSLSKFCFELAVKLWYWSLASYAYDSQTQKCYDPKYLLMSLEVAMKMFELDHHECLEEKGCGTSVLMAWNQQTIVLSFRGTYSAPNVLTDLQLWRVVHPPKRGTYGMGSQPLVHRGFLASWRKDGLNHRVLNRVIQIIHSAKFDESQAKIYITGHSLGGALAVLAAYDLAKYFGLGNHISCYTYGAPRVGNHAFAREFDERVPNAWLVINDEDIVPRVPKLLVLFKHVGEKVIINNKGDMIVCPFAIELSLYRVFTFFKRSLRISQHLLLSYRDSFVAICEAQYMKGKSMEGGMDAMNVLLQQRDKLLSECLALKINRLRQLHRLGSSVWTSGVGKSENLQLGCLL